MYPHERSLVARLKDEPFALVGINSDPIEKIKAAIQRENLSWHMFWDGGDTRGPIATEWGVYSWPTIFVLDENGIVRYTNVRNEKMDEAVDALLAEMKEKQAEKKK